MKFKCTLAYDGSHYLGWQRTPMGPSIEAELSNVLQQLLQEKVDLSAASRTDAGVHATGQVVHFLTGNQRFTPERLKISANSLLPKDIAVITCEEAPMQFHATLDCQSKEYHYQLCWDQLQMPQQRNFSWHYPYELDIDAMRAAASRLIGRRDFTSFCNVRKNQQYASYVRHLMRLDLIELAGKQLRIEVEADHFLYKMVRNLVGTLVYVGCGKLAEKDMMHILQGQDRTCAGITAPSHGLTLHTINY